MTDAFFEKLLTTYGPLGLGWVGFFWAMIRNGSLQDRLLTIATETAKVLTLLTERIERGQK
jgi:hypothetical protein